MGIPFRDYETSGLNSFYDQILTSSAKRYFNGQIVDELYATSVANLSFHLHLHLLTSNSTELENGLPLNSLIQLDHDFNNKYSRTLFVAITRNSTLIFPIAVISVRRPDIYQWKTNHQLLCCLEIIRAVYAFNLDSKTVPLIYLPVQLIERICAENGITYSPHNAAEDVSALIQVFKW